MMATCAYPLKLINKVRSSTNLAMSCLRSCPIVSFVCDHSSMSSTWRPWFGNLTSSVRCLPRHALCVSNQFQQQSYSLSLTQITIFIHQLIYIFWKHDITRQQDWGYLFPEHNDLPHFCTENRIKRQTHWNSQCNMTPHNVITIQVS